MWKFANTSVGWPSLSPRRFLPLALASALTVSAPGAWAWNSAGHRLVAEIAWSQLSPPVRQEVGRLLRAHPDYPRWLLTGKGDDNVQRLFVQVSTWADELRQDGRFYSPGEAEKPREPGYREMARHEDWHYVNHGLRGEASREGELVEAVPRLARQLAQHHGRRADRAYALVWLVHLVADAHQPLHCVARVGPDGRDDAGGNRLWVHDPDNPRLARQKLHAYWDDLPGSPWLTGRALTRRAEEIAGEAAPAPGAIDPQAWCRESVTIARETVYGLLPGQGVGQEDAETVEITPAYAQAAQRVARQRLGQAGMRLAAMLESTLSPTRVSRETP